VMPLHAEPIPSVRTMSRRATRGFSRILAPDELQ
jgi:hypothetical protein